MANIVSYNLGDLTEDAARAKGEVVLKCWHDFQTALAQRAIRLLGCKVQHDGRSAADYVLNG